MSNLSNSIVDILNPFDSERNKEALSNVKTGRITQEAESYLFSLFPEGENKRDKSIHECNDIPERCKIEILPTECFEKKNKSKKADQIVQAFL